METGGAKALRARRTLNAKRGLAKLCSDRIDNFSAGREHAYCRERTGVDDGLAVDQYLEFSIAPLDHIDVGVQFATKTRRHPDGVEAGDSIGAIADGNPSHAHLCKGLTWTGPRHGQVGALEIVTEVPDG